MSIFTSYDKINQVNVYFACSSTNLRENISSYLTVTDTIKKLKHQIPFDWLDRVKRQFDRSLSEREEKKSVLQREGIKAIENCDALIAETSFPSSSVGYQIALALSLKKPVLCLYSLDFGNKVPPQIINADESVNLSIKPYNKESTFNILKNYFESHKDREYIRFNFIISNDIEKYLNWISRYGELSKSRILREKIKKQIINKDKDYQSFLKNSFD